MRCYYLNFTKYRCNNCQETSREKINKHLIASCTYIIQQHTIVYLKITELSTKQTFIKIYKYHVIEHKKSIFHCSVVKADRQPDTMLKCYSEQSVHRL